MRRFFVTRKSISGDLAQLSENESRHITSVLRLHVGDSVELFDEKGTVYSGTISIESSQSVKVHILSQQNETTSPAPHILLYQSMLKGKKMDLIVQKCTELGVHSFHPILTRYSENRGNFERQSRRWQRIMLEACKQSKRTLPMNIETPCQLKTVDFSSFSSKLLLWENEDTYALQQQDVISSDTICLVMGPEGGFQDEEIIWAQLNGFQTVSLGQRILRAETASLSVVAIIQYLCGVLCP